MERFRTATPPDEVRPFSPSPLQPFLEALLAEQQQLDTPVARFSAAHDSALPGGQLDTLARQFTTPTLIPLSAPGPNEQYAFEVDLDACTGCKSCVAACHALNGLDEDETWRDVGLLVGTDRRQPFTQTVTTACHHCEDPACLNGCPVLAYEKDPLSGIVRHLDDQCIGCSYCILKCPYDVPKYSRRLGIVRKCDLCHGRLAHGEAPACAQACPTQAIRVVTVAKRHEMAGEGGPPPVSAFLPSAPDPSYTRPTTRYLTRRGLPRDVIAADAATLHPQPAHWPLAVLLTLMPYAVGCSVFLAASRNAPAADSVALAGWIAGVIGLTCSVLHLGQPRRAWRVFLGLRRSWLSREAVVFGAWLPLASLCAATELGWAPMPELLVRGLIVSSAAIGVLGVACSGMIYVDTRRCFWRATQTFPRFIGTGVVLTLGTCFAAGPTSGALAAALALAVLAKLFFEANSLAGTFDVGDVPRAEQKPGLLLQGRLRPVHEARTACAFLGGIACPALLCAGPLPPAVAWLGLTLLVAGELLERSLYFRAVDAPKMPGVPR